MYGDRSEQTQRLAGTSSSFREVSEREDYLLPTNFKRLDERVQAAAKRGTAPPPLPALATLQGVSYPGSAVLGDARALGLFLARRNICHPDDPDRIQWLVFHDAALKRATQVTLHLDLGEGDWPVVIDLLGDPRCRSNCGPT